MHKLYYDSAISQRLLPFECVHVCRYINKKLVKKCEESEEREKERKREARWNEMLRVRASGGGGLARKCLCTLASTRSGLALYNSSSSRAAVTRREFSGGVPSCLFIPPLLLLLRPLTQTIFDSRSGFKESYRLNLKTQKSWAFFVLGLVKFLWTERFI